jgi:hypothetical protein
VVALHAIISTTHLRYAAVKQKPLIRLGSVLPMQRCFASARGDPRSLLDAAYYRLQPYPSPSAESKLTKGPDPLGRGAEIMGDNLEVATAGALRFAEGSNNGHARACSGMARVSLRDGEVN